MANPLKAFVQEYGWVHLTLGLFGNISFFVGSILFLPTFEPIKVWGVWLFIVGAFFMMVGAFGQLLVSVWSKERQAQGRG